MSGVRIEQVLHKTEGPTVLDLGAVQHDASNADANDWLHGHLCHRFERVVGVDCLADAVENLNARGYEFIEADVTDMSLGIEADTVVAGELIEHIDNPGLMLECIGEHLKPGGKLIMTTPNPWGLPILRRLFAGRLAINDEHVAWFGPEVLEQLLARYNFAVETCETTRRDHGGLTHLAQVLDWDLLGGTTWVLSATYRPQEEHE